MNVKQLIKELEGMPQNAKVYISAHDQSEHEVTGEVFTTGLRIKKELRDDVSSYDLEYFERFPAKWVVIRA